MKIRCSSIGKIMTNPRTKGECLSATARTHVQERFLEIEYGIYKEFWSRYTDKGNQVEDEAILMAESLFDGMFLEKNELKFTNDYLRLFLPNARLHDSDRKDGRLRNLLPN